MVDKFENPNFVMSQENLDLVNKKERESRNAGGMTSSWTEPPDPSLVPPDKMKLILESQAAHAKVVEKEEKRITAPDYHRSSAKSRLVTIPPQAMRSFKTLLNLFGAVQVNLTSDQSKLLLESLEKTPTPKNMVDAKALFNLMEILSQ